MILKEYIKELRIQNNLKLRELSIATGLSISYLSDIEHGRANPSLKTIETLASAFHITVIGLLSHVYSDSHKERSEPMNEPKDYQYFRSYELACKCTHEDCPKHGMDEEFMHHLVAIREKLPFAFIISSGYRCPKHNTDVSTTGENGPHTTGKAVDIRVNGIDARTLVDAAVRHGFEGIGVNQTGPRGRRFIHIDMMERPAGKVIWSY